MPELFSREVQMDPMSPPPSNSNPTTFGGHTNTSFTLGVPLTVEGGSTSQGSLQGCGKHQDQVVVLPDGFLNPAVEGRACPACSLHCEFQGSCMLFSLLIAVAISCLFIKSELHFTACAPLALLLSSRRREQENASRESSALRMWSRV